MFCPHCDRSFRTSDPASFESHKAACKTKSDHKQRLQEIAQEATAAKAETAHQKVAAATLKVAMATDQLKVARRYGAEYSEGKKRERRAAQHAVAQARRGSTPKGLAPHKAGAASYYTAEAEAIRVAASEAPLRSLERAERSVASAKHHLEAAKKAFIGQAKIAEAVRSRVEELKEQPHRSKSAPPRSRVTAEPSQSKSAFLPAHKRGIQDATALAAKKTKLDKTEATTGQHKAGAKRCGKCQWKPSKEVLATNAKRKSEAKKERRQGGRGTCRALGAAGGDVE